MERRALGWKIALVVVLSFYLVCAVCGKSIYAAIVNRVETVVVCPGEIDGVYYRETLPESCLQEKNGQFYIIAVQDCSNFWYEASICRWIPVEVEDSDGGHCAVSFPAEAASVVVESYHSLPQDGDQIALITH